MSSPARAFPKERQPESESNPGRCPEGPLRLGSNTVALHPLAT